MTIRDEHDCKGNGLLSIMRKICNSCVEFSREAARKKEEPEKSVLQWEETFLQCAKIFVWVRPDISQPFKNESERPTGEGWSASKFPDLEAKYINDLPFYEAQLRNKETEMKTMVEKIGENDHDDLWVCE